MIRREYKGHEVALFRTTKSGVPRWIARARIRTPFGEICLCAVVGEDVLTSLHAKMVELAKRFSQRMTSDAEEISGMMLEVEDWPEMLAEYSEIGREETYRDVVQQIDRVVRDPVLQEAASWIPFVNVAARAAALASRAAVVATEPAPPPGAPAPPAGAAPPPVRPGAVVLTPAPAPGAPPVFVLPPRERMRAAAPLPMMPPRVARTAALVGRARAGDRVAREALVALARQAEAGDAMARAMTELATRLAKAGVPALSPAAAEHLAYGAPPAPRGALPFVEAPGRALELEPLPPAYLEAEDDLEELTIYDELEDLVT